MESRHFFRSAFLVVDEENIKDGDGADYGWFEYE